MRRYENLSPGDHWREAQDRFDPTDLLHPARAFEHPFHVVHDPDLTLNEKRAILSAWASDACAVESAPDLRCAPVGQRPVLFADVMDALRMLDRQAAEQSGDSARYRRIIRRQRRLQHWPGRAGNEGQPLN